MDILQKIYDLLLVKKELRKFGLDFTNYTITQQAKTNCNSLQVINNGTSNVSINNALVLIGGQTFTVEGNNDEILVDILTITFDNLGINSCVIIRKTYFN